MTVIKTFARNALLLTVAQIVSSSLSFFYMVFIARYLGVEQFGILSFAIAFVGIFGIVTDLGLSTLATRDIARDESLARKYLGTILTLKIALVVIAYGLIAVTINLLGYPSQTIIVVYLLALSTIILAFVSAFYSVFRAFQRLEFQSFATILQSGLLLGGALLVITLNAGIFGIAIAYSVSSAAVLLFSVFICTWKFVKPRFQFEWSFARHITWQSLPFALIIFSSYLYTWIDTTLLSLMKGSEVVGWYSAAYKLILAFSFIPVVIQTAVFPIMSKYFVSSQDSLRLVFEKLLKIMLILALPLGIATMFTANQIILLVFGEQYLNTVIALQILIWSLVVIFIRTPFEQLLQSGNRQRVVSNAFIAGVIFNVIANVIFIPRYSYIGAGIITVLTDFLILLILVGAARSSGFAISKNERSIVGRILLANIILGGFLMLSLSHNLLVTIASAVVVYVVVSIVLRTVDRDDVKLIRSAFTRGASKNENVAEQK
jgi:O-antigen/teichoic acid export membrane protein